ncbi:hypothetical protein JXQ70_16160 [bacterium]|nr:hypothetical protein [bacterium]
MSRIIHEKAGQKADRTELVSREQMRQAYYSAPDVIKPVKNGTSGHRGTTGEAFTDLHVAAMTQALIDIRRAKGSFGPDLPAGLAAKWGQPPLGPVLAGKDVRFSSDFALETAAEVFAGNAMPLIIQRGDRATPTPVISRTILRKNGQGSNVEGVIITASHNPPEEAGYKSNGRNGGPNTQTRPIDERANHYLNHPELIKRKDYERAVREQLVIEEDFMQPYVSELDRVIDLDVLKGVPFAATPLGGSAHGYYEAINDHYRTSFTVIMPEPDPSGTQKTRDWDGKLRGDPSSEYVMKALEGFREKLGVPFIGANDNDADRFGGEDATAGILNPNHVLCVLFDYLCRYRDWPPQRGIGRTIGTTHLLDLIAAEHRRPVHEVNVGFKYYVDGLITGQYILAGEESAGLCLPCRDGSLWITEKDGIAAVLLIMEIIARTGKDMGTLYTDLVSRFGPHQYERIDMPATPMKKNRLLELCRDPQEVRLRLESQKIAGCSVERLVIGDGIKVVLEGGIWVLKRASGTENIIKDYREERGDSLETVRKASAEIDALLDLPE